MDNPRKGAIVSGTIGSAVIIFPVIIACILDPAFVSMCHVPVIGVAGIAVALCDAFFGQVISYTQSVPFSPIYTPARAKELVDQFDSLHRKILREWIIAKLASGTTVTLSAIMVLSLNHGPPDRSLQIIGYIALGISLRSVLFFIVTYLKARDVNHQVRLEEISMRFEKENQPKELSKETLRALEEQSSQYNAPPTTLKH